MAVSFPEWENDTKDVNDAVVRYGKSHLKVLLTQNRLAV